MNIHFKEITMKKNISVAFIALLSISSTLEARPWARHHIDWVSPLIVTGSIGYLLPRERVYYVERPTVIYTSPTTSMVSDSSSYASIQYEETWVYFEDCECERKVMIRR
jgi:hypothetical protein